MKNVFIVLCDTLRAKSLPHYGNKRNTIPNLTQAIDRDFIVYDRAYAPAPWTIPSHLSLFTGLYPSQVMESPNSLRLDSNFITMANIFQDSGYTTLALSTNELISKKFGFDKGFDSFLQFWLPNPKADEMPLNLKGKNNFERVLKTFRLIVQESNKSNICRALNQKIYRKFSNILDDATPSTNKAMKMLKQYISENSDQKSFCFVNLMQTHEKYNPPKKTRNRFVKDNKEYNDFHFSHDVLDHYAIKPFSDELLNYLWLRYEEEILHLDTVISDFIEFLKKTNLYDNSLVIITSDHGEHFGENGCFAHHFSIYDPVIRIPMYIKWPGKSENSSRVKNDLVVLHDIYSTFLNLLDHWQPCPDSSVDLTSSNKRSFILSQLPDMTYAVEGCRKRRNDFSLADAGLSDGGLNAYILNNGLKIIENGNNAVEYNLESDPEEKNPSDVNKEKLQVVKSKILN